MKPSILRAILFFLTLTLFSFAVPLSSKFVSIASAAITPGAILNLDASNASSYSGSGTTWTDLTSNGNNVALSGASYNAANKAISFSNPSSALSSGTGNYAYFTTPSNFYSGSWSGFSASFYANMGTGANYWSRILDFSTQSSISGGMGDIYIARVWNTDDLSASFWSANGSQSGDCVATGIISNSAFAHYAVTITQNGTCYWYKNGSQFGSALSTGSSVPVPIATSRSSLFIGRSHWNDTYLNGLIRNLAIYNSSLTSQQVLANYSSQSGNSSDASLASLSISSAALSPNFSTEKIAYEAFVSPSTNSVTITLTLNDQNASAQIKVGGGSFSNVTPGTPSVIPLSQGSNLVTVQVTAQNGSTTSSCTINITREFLQTIDLANPPTTQILLKFRVLSILNVSILSSGKVTFYANNKRIPGCINIASITSASCSYKPMTHGGIQIKALVTPDSGNSYSVPINIGVANRMTAR